ncbi:Tetratricopeptide TPR_2 repeat protein [Rippkaea orientalis PCC 8801]|uniref:Tetratricopeptide TPR_2 repeat protein n=1 Tax=Rippkaea orientalis (strain PCC 8801 / RF-1) TaxID=41431 RepID=B7JXM6_RIPO1|nr:tetratricopeptide repeat protein [Rippkaea orientalis]ACK64783.1 Tetratricopeptide TPR_2 repeat protein [Rippkaea orientalis PCC 8801]
MNKIISKKDNSSIYSATLYPTFSDDKSAFLKEEDEEEYQTLLRSVSWTEGFGLFFVECFPTQGTKIINRFKKDLPKKTIELLKLTDPISSLYSSIEKLSSKQKLDILFIQGLEHSLNEYIKPGYGGQGDYYKEDTVPAILGHLNLQRERFRDNFNICLIFLLPKFAIKYFIRRAPDFYDWRSGTFEFSTDKELLDKAIEDIKNKLEDHDIDDLSIEECKKRILEIDAILDEDNNNSYVADKPKLLFKKGNLLFKVGYPIEGINSYYEAVDISPNYIQVWERLGFILFRIYQYEEAIFCLDKVINIKPNDDSSWHLRGLCLSSLGRLEEALESLDQALEVNPNDSFIWGNKGKLLNQLEEYQQALLSFNRSLELDPENDEIWYLKGKVLSELKKYEEALNSFDKALEIHSNYYEAWGMRGVILVNLQYYKQALISFDKLIEINPNDYQGWLNRGIALIYLKRHQEALKSLNKALEINSDDDMIWGNKGVVLRNLGHYQEALESFDNAIKLDFNNDRGWFHKGITLIKLKQYQEALKCLDKALEIDPNDHNTLIEKGNTLYLLQCYEQALISFKKAIEVNPNDSDDWNACGYLLLNQSSANDQPVFDIPLEIIPIVNSKNNQLNESLNNQKSYQEALSYFDKAIELKPDYSLVFANRSFPLYYLGEYQEALKSCIKAIKLKPHKEVKEITLANKGFILMKLERYKQALSTFKEVLKLNPNHQNVLYKIACCYSLQNNTGQAIKYLKQAIKLKPEKYINLAKDDPYFTKIKQDARFQRLQLKPALQI